jgi:hypothetical protein
LAKARRDRRPNSQFSSARDARRSARDRKPFQRLRGLGRLGRGEGSSDFEPFAESFDDHFAPVRMPREVARAAEPHDQQRKFMIGMVQFALTRTAGLAAFALQPPPLDVFLGVGAGISAPTGPAVEWVIRTPTVHVRRVARGAVKLLDSIVRVSAAAAAT